LQTIGPLYEGDTALICAKLLVLEIGGYQRPPL